MFDVVVIGAGPGGSQAARSLAQRGRRVALIDSRHDIGNKLCTGIISLACAREYGVRCELYRFVSTGATVYGPGGRPIRIRRPDAQAVTIDREAFVRDVAEGAAAAGAELLLGFRATEVLTSRHSITVIGDHAGRTRVLEASAVVLATGFQAPLARGIGVDVPSPIGFAAQMEVETDGADEVQVFARRHLPATSFGWISPTGRSTAHIGILGRERPRPAFERFMESLRSEGLRYSPLSPARYWGVPLRASRRSYAHRCLVVGDAAGQIKPTTGGGIYYALQSGDLAARTLDEALETGDLSRKSLSKYEQQWKGFLGREIRLGYMARLFYERLTDNELDRILEAADDSGILEGDISFDHHTSLLTTALKSRLFMSVVGAVPGVAARIAVSR